MIRFIYIEIKQKGINEEQIIYINFESLDYSFIKTAKDLNDYIKNQVCYSLSEEETKEREFGAYSGIDDSYPKYIISLKELDISW